MSPADLVRKNPNRCYVPANAREQPQAAVVVQLAALHNNGQHCPANRCPSVTVSTVDRLHMNDLARASHIVALNAELDPTPPPRQPVTGHLAWHEDCYAAQYVQPNIQCVPDPADYTSGIRPSSTHMPQTSSSPYQASAMFDVWQQPVALNYQQKSIKNAGSLPRAGPACSSHCMCVAITR